MTLGLVLARRPGMTVRMETTSDDGTTTVMVSGRLTSACVPAFLRTCESAEGDCVLDLDGLRAADAEGLEAIRELVRAGTELRGVSQFIRLLLDEQPPANAD
jgi:hypothetical protein